MRTFSRQVTIHVVLSLPVLSWQTHNIWLFPLYIGPIFLKPKFFFWIYRNKRHWSTASLCRSPVLTLVLPAGAMPNVAGSCAAPRRLATGCALVSWCLPYSRTLRLLHSTRRAVATRHDASLIAGTKRCMRHQWRAEPPGFWRPDSYPGETRLRNAEIPRIEGLFFWVWTHRPHHQHQHHHHTHLF